MKKTSFKRIISAALALGTVLAMTACSGGGSAPAATTAAAAAAPAATQAAAAASKGSYTFKFADVVADDHPYNQGARYFKEKLEAAAKEAGYDVKMDIYSNSALGGERELAESMQLGTLDMALIPGCAIQFNSKFGLIDLPYLFESKEVAHKVLDGEIGKELAKDMPQESQLRLLCYWENGFRNMTNSKRAIRTPEDVAGLTMRTPETDVYVAFFKNLGANVVAMSFSELYTALQQKTIDGQENPSALIATNKLYEAQPYMSLTEHIYGPSELCISEKIWQTLPADLQEIIQKTSEEARDYERQVCADLEASYVKQIEDAGTEVTKDIDKSLFQDAAKKVWEQYKDQYGEYITRIQNGDY